MVQTLSGGLDATRSVFVAEAAMNGIHVNRNLLMASFHVSPGNMGFYSRFFHFITSTDYIGEDVCLTV